MKSGDFQKLIVALANAYRNVGAMGASGTLVEFSGLFSMTPASTPLSKVVKQLNARSFDAKGGGQPSLSDIASLISSIPSFVEAAAGPKSKANAEVAALLQFLISRPNLTLPALLAPPEEKPNKKRKSTAKPAVHEELVKQYEQQFLASIETEESFANFLGALASDSEMGTAETAALAKAVAGSGGRSRDASLKKIQTRFQSLAAQRARLSATKGRSAA